VTTPHIGIIAEDDSDIYVLTQLAKKLTTKRFSVSKFIGKGCGALKRKTPGWCSALAQKGCASVVVVHDRDRHDEGTLRRELEHVLAGVRMGVRVVVIPCEELEAWLLSDTKALQSAMNLHTVPKVIAHPEAIVGPKEHLAKLVLTHSKNKSKRYVNTVHNPLIAEVLSASAISRRCPSFKHFQRFIKQAIG
jgi:hypothetical protein